MESISLIVLKLIVSFLENNVDRLMFSMPQQIYLQSYRNDNWKSFYDQSFVINNESGDGWKKQVLDIPNIEGINLNDSDFIYGFWNKLVEVLNQRPNVGAHLNLIRNRFECTLRHIPLTELIIEYNEPDHPALTGLDFNHFEHSLSRPLMMGSP
ncbi:hypothetical protein SAMD00019534_004670 [Acytostelium subglobosum LB1]|uniref:hypothetical protein n=1 Tax=Acytostelium subglobosum LB1 TaxID=1410327 RepID=UPI0006449035|nr:hypothetical protein SAMD00019534_004670 [Acytostelium subglobosum LB1]GAM17292.1 hypothetical protein SAMD00019534_004670 [Acytostelium subglobosum LB1]|eukprot:XP_012759354.1 hypothetical protein SAMD00019534_004670 [Acytostelium subglobosum LB1]